MYKLSRRKNLIPFLVLLVLGMACSAFAPALFRESQFEIPALALFPAEIALVMMMSVFIFENATPAELIRIAFTMLGISMVAGGLSNIISSSCQKLPDEILLLSWVQLACMNLTGLIATIALYQTKAPQQQISGATRPATIKDQGKDADLAAKEAAGAPAKAQTGNAEPDKLEAGTGETARELLSKLEGRFNDTGQQNQTATLAGDDQTVSLESFLANENHKLDQAASLDRRFDTDAIGPTTKSRKTSASELNDALDAMIANSEASMSAADSNGEATPSMSTLMAEPAPPAVEAQTPAAEKPLIVDDSSIDLGFDDLGIIAPATEPFKAIAAAEQNKAIAPVSPASAGGLFTDVDSDLDDIFATLAGYPGDFNPAAPTITKAPTDTSASVAPISANFSTTPAAEGRLFDDVSGEIEDIFKRLAPDAALQDISDTLGTLAGSPSSTEATEAAPSAQPTAIEVKEFGRLSTAATAKTELETPGTLKTIGQMLLDPQAIQNIIKRSEGKDTSPAVASAATARVVSVSRGADIQNMLNRICSYPGVDGCLVIGKDGLLIGATDSLGMMRDVLGVLALGIHSTTNLGTKKSDMGELRQSILRSGQKLTVLTEIGIGILGTFSDTWNLSALDGMIDHIGRVVNESQASGGASLPMESLSGGLLATEPATPPPPATQPAAVATAQREAIVSLAEAKGGLINLNDDDLGSLFEGVLADQSKQDDAISIEAKAPTLSAQRAAGALLNLNDDDMTDLFDNLIDKSASAAETSMNFSPECGAAPPAEKTEAPLVTEKAKKADASKGQQMKEFGRLSASSASHTSSEGAIKAIGPQLIDIQAVENIIKAGEKQEKMGGGITTARVISAARGEGIKALLTKIDGCPGVIGSVIVGNDGLVIASTLKGGLDKDLIGALCNAMHSHTNLAARKVSMGKTRQIILHAANRITILTSVAVGVLAVFADNTEPGQIDILLNAIESTVRG